MSAYGTKRTCPGKLAVSAFGGKADIGGYRSSGSADTISGPLRPRVRGWPKPPAAGSNSVAGIVFWPDHHHGALWRDDIGTVVVVDVDELVAGGIHPLPLAGVTAIGRLGVDPAADDVLPALDHEEELRGVRIAERVEQGRFGFLDDIGCCWRDLQGSDQSDEYEFAHGR